MNKEKLKEILSIQTASEDQWRMFAYIIRALKQIPNVTYYTHNGNIYATRGHAKTYPCMVAHMDTVHDIVEDLYPFEAYGCITGMNRIRMEQTGIGGDDKVGVFITLEMLERFENIKVAFFRDEEIGCNGSYVADMTFFDDCRFVLQCDRKGNDDFVTVASGVDLSSCDFQEAVQPVITRFGYKFASGMMTDVMALKQNGIKCSVANMSCGYYRPHSADEYVDIEDVQNCLVMCQTIISRCTDTYKHKHTPVVYTSHRYAKGFQSPIWSDAPSYTAQKPKKAKDAEWGDWGPSDFDDFHDAPLAEKYCDDCWSRPAVRNGLCDTCYSWYTRDNDRVIF